MNEMEQEFKNDTIETFGHDDHFPRGTLEWLIRTV